MRKRERNHHGKILRIIAYALLFLCSSYSFAQISCNFEISTSTSEVINPVLEPGDTLCLLAGVRGPLYLKGIIGTADKPIVIINKGGQSIIDSELAYGIKFAECEHVLLSGSGDSNSEYGILIRQVTNGNGISITAKSTDFELEKLEISNVLHAGIVAKTDPNCIYLADRDNFTMYNVSIHDNYIHDIGTEGMYIGSSFFLGQYIESCDENFLPHIIDGVKIFNNRVEYTGWDGIQVGSALNNCDVHDNQIYKDSQAEVSYQMSGIIINTGSSCNVYNNKIIDGKGTGIMMLSTGGQKVFNNLIVNAGRTYDFANQETKQQFGIFCNYQYIQAPDSSFHFYNNTIINPKSDGIRFMNEHSDGNQVINNIIINPGTYEYYENLGSVNYVARDSYVHNYLDVARITVFNNIFERSSKDQFFHDTLTLDYHLTNKSSLAINKGFNLSNQNISFDIDNLARPFDVEFDIGAYEYQMITDIFDPINEADKITLAPNPTTTDKIEMRFELDKAQSLSIKLVSMEGKEITLIQDESFHQGSNTKNLSLVNLPSGSYALILFNKSFHIVKKIQKL